LILVIVFCEFSICLLLVFNTCINLTRGLIRTTYYVQTWKPWTYFDVWCIIYVLTLVAMFTRIVIVRVSIIWTEAGYVRPVHRAHSMNTRVTLAFLCFKTNVISVYKMSYTCTYCLDEYMNRIRGDFSIKVL